MKTHFSGFCCEFSDADNNEEGLDIVLMTVNVWA